MMGYLRWGGGKPLRVGGWGGVPLQFMHLVRVTHHRWARGPRSGVDVREMYDPSQPPVVCNAP